MSYLAYKHLHGVFGQVQVCINIGSALTFCNPYLEHCKVKSVLPLLGPEPPTSGLQAQHCTPVLTQALCSESQNLNTNILTNKRNRLSKFK